jgi:hypothetical protein
MDAPVDLRDADQTRTTVESRPAIVEFCGNAMLPLARSVQSMPARVK